MKYNKSQIMKTAWNLIKNYGISRSTAMKAAWAQAKVLNKAAELGENSWYETYEVKSSNWVKYNKNRTYIDMIGISNGRVQKTYKVGYVDNMTGAYYVA